MVYHIPIGVRHQESCWQHPRRRSHFTLPPQIIFIVMPPKRHTSILSPVAGMSPRINENVEYQSADEFTRSVKRKLSSSTRTGQACDRCKVSVLGLSSFSLTNTGSTDQEDKVRWTARGMLSMHAKPNRVSHNRSNITKGNATWICGKS